MYVIVMWHLNTFDQSVDSDPANVIPVDSHSCQWRTANFTGSYVIESDNRNIFWNPIAKILQCIHSANTQVIQAA